MTATTTVEELTANLSAKLDEEEAAAKAAASGDPRARSWSDRESDYPLVEDGWHVVIVPPGPTWGQVRHIARQDPARTLRQVTAHREILDRYAETLRDYARSLERARGGPVANADLDDFEAELPVLRSIVEIIAGIYEEPVP